MVTIRNMTRGDIPRVTTIHRAILQEATGKEPEAWTEGAFVHLLEAFPAGCLVAEHDAEVVGFIVGTHKRWGFGLRLSGWIEAVGVHPDHMGEGVGKALGEAILSHFKSQGIADVYTAVLWDAGDLINFFKSVGFRKSEFINLRYGEGE